MKGLSRTDPSEKGLSRAYPFQVTSHNGTFNIFSTCYLYMRYLHCPSGSRVLLGRCIHDNPSSVVPSVLLGVFIISYVCVLLGVFFYYYTFRSFV